MNRRLEFDPRALAELECATGDYESRKAGLGARFRRIVESASRAFLENPMLWRERPGGYRRVNLPGFPFFLAFILHDNRVRVVAVAHVGRKPGYWDDRLP